MLKKKKSRVAQPAVSGNVYENSMRNEVAAAFAWARMTNDQRQAFKQKYSTDAQSIVANIPDSQEFDFEAFQKQAGKKNFGENFSRHLAARLSRALAPWFDGILPDPKGAGHESKARTSKGFKKLDVNYSTPQLGLGLGVSIKTINARDNASKRYTKNYTRVDAELRAEAADYHERQPYAVMIAIIFLPMDACSDGSPDTPSSFGAAVKVFRHRAKRERASDPVMLFERVYVGLYNTDPNYLGEMLFVDVEDSPPRTGRPKKSKKFKDVVNGIREEYDGRNNPVFKWEDGQPERDISVEEAGEDEEQ